MSAEGKIGIGLGLFALLGAGATVAFPTYTWIGWAMMAVAAFGGVGLAIHHFCQSWPPIARWALFGVGTLVVSALLAWHFWPALQPLPKAIDLTLSPPPPKHSEPPPHAAEKPSSPPPKTPTVAKVLPKEISKEKVAAEVQPLFVECNNGFMPTLNIGPNDRVEVLELSGTPGRAILGQMFLLAGGAFNMNGADKTPRQAWTCKMTNYNSTPIIGVNISVHIKWYKTAKEGNTTHVVSPDIENDSPNEITKIEPGSSNPFVFYVVSYSDELAEMTFPTSVTGTRLDTNETLSIPLRVEPPLMQIWPGP